MTLPELSADTRRQRSRGQEATGVDPVPWTLYPLGEEGVHDAEDPTAVSPAAPGAAHRVGPSGRTPEELGRQFEPSGQTIRNWLRQADRMRAGARTG